MRNLTTFILMALFIGACAAPGFDDRAPTPTPFQPGATTAINEDAPIMPADSPAPPEIQAPADPVLRIPEPATANWVPVADGFRRPVFISHAGDDRLFIVEQEGLIWILQDGVRLPDPFLDIRRSVNDGANEQGLLGLAFHPDYAQNGFFYVNYTGSQDETRISRFARGDEAKQADPTSETTLLTIAQPYRNHNGGALVFGPDGYLYIGTGDGGSGGDPLGNGQRTDTLLGKILRLDVDGGQPYAIPSTNPFAQGGGLPEIWAYGLRNPWRIAFDRINGDLYIADVGQNQWEEINHQPSGSQGGENYGWNVREGTHPYAGGGAAWVDPVAEYDHGQGCSVTGGVVVRDPRLPAWSGVYLYGDYCQGKVWGLLRVAGGWSNQFLYSTGLTISSFGQDALGRVYLVDHDGGIYRLDPGS